MALKIYIDTAVENNRQIIFEHTTSDTDTGTLPKVQAKLEPRYDNAAGTVAFLHDHDSYLRFYEAAAPGVLKEYFLASEIQDQSGTPVGDLDAVKAYLSDKMGFKPGGGTPLTTLVDRFDAFVGTGDEEFSTINAAIVAGRKRILVKTNITETVSSTIASGTILLHVVGDSTATFGANRILLNGVGTTLIVEGHGNVSYTGTVVNNSFIAPSGESSPSLLWEGVDFTNNSTAAGATLCDESFDKQVVKNCKVICGDGQEIGIKTSFGHENLVENVEFVGVGSSTYAMLDLRGASKAKNITFTGDTSDTNNIFQSGTSSKVDGVSFDLNNSIFCELNGISTGIIAQGGSEVVNIDINSDNAELSNSELNNGIIDIKGATQATLKSIKQFYLDASNTDSFKNVIDSCIIGNEDAPLVDNTAVPPTEVLGDSYTLDYTGSTNAAWDGAEPGTQVTFDGSLWVSFPNSYEGDANKIVNNIIYGNSRLNGDRNRMSGNTVEIGTIFVDAAALKTKLEGNETQVALIDNNPASTNISNQTLI